MLRDSINRADTLDGNFEYLVEPQIAKVSSNKEHIHYFSYSDKLKVHSATGPFKASLSFKVVRDLDKPSNLTQKFHFTTGSESGEEIFYERPLGLNITAKMHINNLISKCQITVNNSYYKFVRARFDNVYPPGVHLTDILTLNLLTSGYLPLHCAAIATDSGDGILLPAPPDTGKSLTSILASRRGFYFMAEDIAIVDSEYVYSNANTATFLYHKNELEDSKFRHRFSINPILHRIPLLPYYISRPNKSISKTLSSLKLTKMTRIKKILVLDRGNSHVTRLHPDEALRRILLINRNEFSYHKNSVLFAYSYFNPNFNLIKLIEKEQEILRTLTARSECHLLKANDPKEYIELLISALR